MSHRENARRLKELLPQLRHANVADLAWSVFSTPLTTQLTVLPDILIPRFTLNRSRIDWLRSLDEDPRSLLNHLKQPKTKRLGQYFEALWEYFLLQDAGTELLAKNLQVQHQGRTLGEFDFIYRDNSGGEIVHLELAVKLYLGFAMQAAPDSSPMDWWQGPNCIDRLDLKIAKLSNKQLKLGDNAHAKKTLADLNIDSIKPALFIGGYLYYPDNATIAPPKIIDPSHQRGKWIYLRDIKTKLDPGHRYLMLKKSQWLCRHQHRTAPATYQLTELQRHLAVQLGRWGRPVLVCAVCETDTGWQEQQRLFVVPDNWPVILFEHR